MNPPAREGRRLGSVGKAIDGVEVRVLGPENSEAAVGTVGEIAVRGPTVMLGYRGLPEATSEAIPDGWLRTGDLGYFDRDGFLFLTDRKKDIIIRGGENISASEIEEVLYSHPLVAEAAVVGVPDSAYGERVIAFVVLRPQAQSGSADVLLAHCKNRLARFKVPTQVKILDGMPKNAVGKIAKQELRLRSTAPEGH
jgi:long-chain acyl-CoA synthetase